ncbi:Twin-arginine translocation protein TatB [Serinicoccus hydrothermalis]|uniref:Twin-arginine translocation protein TatB n=1 Tax=Serinicoccus hydrothermalis TaxID=1758689 RepID=A0A1B1NG61_9MICO|nr:Sec-independent protein translocase TatB [Serinicoccus hydrothermalis]ANS80402.1 Twin-arginine translocation protein TatB [Serinicoccus hydrothermalis]
MIGNLAGGEILLLVLAALIVLGPTRLPGYAAKLGQGVRYLRDLAEGAKGQLRDELGPGFDDIDWRQLDPRQYDPRRIVREALSEPPTRSGAREDEPDEKPVSARMTPALPVHDPTLPTPFDVDAT